jgi:hypothetical protein
MERWKYCPYDGHSYRPADTACSVCYRLRQPASGELRQGGIAETNRKWRKILYEKQPYPDNYTDEETFLEALQTNRYVFLPLTVLACILKSFLTAVVSQSM